MMRPANARELRGCGAGKADRRLRGVALLLTLMVLVLVSVLIVQYQVEASMYLRSSSYQIEQLQARYAAESGLVIATSIIRNLIYEQHEIVQIQQNGEDSSEVSPEELEGMDPNLVAEPIEPPRASFVINTYDIDVGEVEVEIELQDENAKWPMVWLLRSPFRSRNTQKNFTQFGESMGMRRNDVYRAYSEAVKIGRQLDKHLPPLGTQIVVESRRNQDATRSRYQNYRRFRTRETQLKEEKQRREAMGEFAQAWQLALKENEELAGILEPLPNRGDALNDFLGVWGSFYVNVNTASPEMMLSLFEPLGLEESHIDSIVEMREQGALTRSQHLYSIPGVNRETAEKLSQICVVRPVSFSVHVTARIGRTSYKLVGSIYDHKGQVRFLSMVTTDDA